MFGSESTCSLEISITLFCDLKIIPVMDLRWLSVRIQILVSSVMWCKTAIKVYATLVSLCGVDVGDSVID